jgi:adenylate cyclase
MEQTGVKPGVAASVHDWLISDAGFLDDLGVLLEEFCRRLLAAGLPLVRVTAHIRVLHSERVGVTRAWRRDQPLTLQIFGFGPEVEAMYQRSPIRVVHEERKRLELRSADPASVVFGITPELIAAGITHYVIFPLFFTGGQVNAASFSTDREGGFHSSELELIESLLPAISRIMELKALQRSRRDLLGIYVGRLPAERILDGQIRRGDVVGIEAAILLCDLHRSTELSIELEESAYVQTLNQFFDCVVPAVTAAGGDVLKFIGDAVLAIFAQPARAGDTSHCDAALTATDAVFEALRDRNERHRESGAPLDIAIALHEGHVAFGNVGSVERQDFTVIGQDVNLAARLCALSSGLAEPLLISGRFASRVPNPMRKLGEFPLRGFGEPQGVYAPAG